MGAFSSRYEAALTLAAKAHSGQFRKGTDVPYIVHPVHVAAILRHYGFSGDVVISGLLHDVIEDSGVSLECIEESLGSVVMTTVSVLTEKKRGECGEIPWEERRAATLKRLHSADISAVAVSAADTLHNAATLAADLRKYGGIVWKRFHRGAGPILAHYRAVLNVVQDKLGNHPLVTELATVIHDLEQANAERRGAPGIKVQESNDETHTGNAFGAD